jgi:ferrous iron transport protein A
VACELLFVYWAEIESEFHFEPAKDVSEDQMNQTNPESMTPEIDANSEPLTLDSIPHGLWARVLEILDSGVGSLRLMEMGLVPGAPVSVVRSAPLGDPIQIRIRDYDLALRRGEARTIAVAISTK